MAVLRIRMLGNLSMEYNGKEVERDFSGNGKILQLFLILAWAGEKGISRGKLQDYLYDVRTANSGNALRVTLSRLRRQLADNGVTGPDAIQYRGGVYVLNDDALELEVDAVLLERACSRAFQDRDPESRLALLEQAAGYYKGEFLPAMSGDSWVEAMRGKYQGLYENCIREACALLKSRNDQEKVAALCAQALQVCPMDEWSEWLIESLLALGKYREAKKAYDEAASLFFGHEGQEPSRNRMEKFRKMGSKIQMMERSSQDVKDGLKEEGDISGAYRCSYPGFLDCFHMCVRMAERKDSGSYLMICTVVSRNGREVQSESRMGYYSELLCQVAGSQLRRGDVYTVYRPGQVLILLNFLRKKNLESVKERLRSGFREKSARKATLRFETMDVFYWQNQEERARDQG